MRTGIATHQRVKMYNLTKTNLKALSRNKMMSKSSKNNTNETSYRYKKTPVAAIPQQEFSI
jgi:hypothetical protein